MKKLKALALVLAVMMCMVGFVGCSNSGDEKKDTDAKTTESADATEEAVSEEIPEGGTFTVGFDASFPPYGYTADDGSYTGFDIESLSLCLIANLPRLCYTIFETLSVSPFDADNG